MKNQMPPIEAYMTPLPYTIGSDIAVKKAQELMREYRIRHLPVQQGGKLVGILSDRDVKLASAFDNGWNFKCEEVMTPDPYAVRASTPVDQVVREMIARKFGSAIVQDSTGKVIGIFTDIDALKAFSELLGQKYRSAAA